MSISKIASWLCELGLDKYVQSFLDNEIAYEDLPELTETDLKELGLPIGPRRRVIKAVREADDLITRPASELMPVSSATGAERRRMTVMFCDLVDSTALAEQLDPEDLREQLTVFRVACENAVKAHDGFVARYMGDGLLVYFGYPIASEDDAARSARAGLAVVEAVSAIDSFAAKMSVRVGIATGLVVVGDAIGEGSSVELSVLGQSPNLAARLQSLAAPNTVLLAPHTKRLVETRFELQVLPAQKLKGIEKPVTPYLVVAEINQSLESVSKDAKLMGRDLELALLKDRWQSTLEGENQVVLISGEAGVGKSRLISEFRDSLDDQAHYSIMCFAAPHHSNTAYYPITQRLEQDLGFSSISSPERRVKRVMAVVNKFQLDPATTATGIADLLELSPYLPWACEDVEPGQRKNRIIDAVQSVINTISGRRPVIFLMEDAHWADASTIDLLRSMLAYKSPNPCLLIISFRPEFSHAWKSDGNLTTLSLTRLSRREAPKMVMDLAGNTMLSEAVINRIVERADGIPLYIEELTKTLLQSDNTIDDASIPLSLHDSLTARLDRLGPAKSIAQMAAVVGRTFHRYLVESVSQLDADTFDDMMNRLVDVGLVNVHDSIESTYEFKHALVRDIAYDSLLKAPRHAIHQQIVSVLRKQATQSNMLIGDLTETLAHHSHEGELWDQAFYYSLESGKRAITRVAHVEAIEHLERSLDALGRLERTDELIAAEIDVCMLLRGSHAVVSDVNKMLTVARRAEVLAIESNDQPRLAQISIHLAFVLSRGADISGSIIAGERARAIGEALGDKEMIAGARISTSHAHFNLGSPQQVVELLQPISDYLSHEARHLQICSSMTSSVNGFVNLAMALAEIGSFDDAETYGLEALAIGRETGRLMEIGYAELALGWVMLSKQDYQQAETYTSAALRDWSEGESHAFVDAALGVLARVYLALQQPEIAADLAQQALVRLVSAKNYYWQVMALEASALALAAQNNNVAADRTISQAIALSKQHSFRGREANAIRISGVVHFLSGEYDKGTLLLEEALQLAQEKKLVPLIKICQADLKKYGAPNS